VRSFIRVICLLALCTGAAPAQDQAASQGGSAAAQPSQNSAKTIRIGDSVAQASLVKQVTPVYPAIAKTAHISGTVVLHAVIGTDGKIADLQYVSGPPLLMKSAMDAVHQWEYRPTALNGEPVRVDTTISVVFTLGGTPDAGSGDASPSTAPGGTDADASRTAAAIDGNYRADAVQFLDSTHYRQTAQAAMRQMSTTIRPQLIAAFPATPNRDKIVDEYLERLEELPNSPEFTEMIIRIYVKYFTDDDLKALVAFYQSPAGQHYAGVQTQIVTDAAAAGQQLGKQRGLDILVDLCKEYPELRGESKFCPADAKETGRVENPSRVISGGE
jgi:TonB family protein